MEGTRAVLDRITEFLISGLSQDIQDYKERANVSRVKFPSTYDNGVHVEVIVIDEHKAAEDKPAIIFVHGGGMSLGSAYAPEVCAVHPIIVLHSCSKSWVS